MKEELKAGFTVDLSKLNQTKVKDDGLNENLKSQPNQKFSTSSTTCNANTNLDQSLNSSNSFDFFSGSENETLEQKKGFVLDAKLNEELYQREEVKVNEEGASFSGGNEDFELEEYAPQKATFYTNPIVWFLTIILALSVYQTYSFLVDAFSQGSISGIIWSSVFALLFLMLIYSIIRELGSLLFLEESDKRREHINKLIKEGSFKEALGVTKELADSSKVNPQKYKNFKAKLQTHFDPKSVFELYEDDILKEQDKKAINLIIKRSAEIGFVVALSPLAWLDMFLSLVRALRMIRELSLIYGHKCSFIARMSLYRRVFKGLIFIGATDLATDALLDVFGTSAVRRLSASIGQGVAASIYATRVGYIAMKTLRPIEVNKRVITLGALRKGVLSNPRIKELLLKEKNKKED